MERRLLKGRWRNGVCPHGAVEESHRGGGDKAEEGGNHAGPVVQHGEVEGADGHQGQNHLP